ncbi:MAG: hypothetical protein LC648_06085 [Novosphingobium sp.]|nr:hypothetical protein [Novosphingobium sp.]
MRTLAWPCPAPGGSGEEFALVAGPEDAAARVLLVPALFEEANKTRRLLAETMRALAARGVASVLPDLPGCGESLAPLELQDLDSWRAAVRRCARRFRASHYLAIRGGAVLLPRTAKGWSFEPVAGASLLRTMVRARTIAAREEGREETAARLLDLGRVQGLELAGYRLGARMIAGLERADLPKRSKRLVLTLADLGGEPLWRRSEPGEDPALAAALAARIAVEATP